MALTKAEKIQRAKDIVGEIEKTAGWTPEQSAQMRTYLLENEAAAEHLGNSTARHSEYSSALDKARDLETKLNEAAKYQQWYEKNYAVANAAVTEAARYRERYGALDETPNPVPANNGASVPAGMTKAEIEQLLTDRDNRWASITKTGLRLASRHAAEYKEALDIDAIEKIAIEKSIPLDIAYEEFVRPRVQEAEKKRTDEEIKRRVDEGIAAERSRMGSHGAFIPAQQSGFSDYANKGGKVAATDDAELANMWVGIQSGNGTK